MKFKGRICNNCQKSTKDVYAEKGWIFFDERGTHVTDGRLEGQSIVKVYFAPLKFALSDDSLDFCSLKCFLEWLFLSEIASNNKHSTIEERKKFMQEILEKSKLKFY